MKTALVTGGSGDIGREVCLALGAAGYSVGVQYHKNQASAQSVADEIERQGGRAVAVQCDVAEEESADRAVSAVEKAFGGVDLLVNNAGISQIKLFDEITAAEWNRMIGVNLTGAFIMSKRCVKNMIREKRGSIINISSIWGQVGASCEVHYSASKGGMIAMTKALAKEIAPSGIRVNCICPGVIDTKMNSHLTEREMAELKEEIPLGILGTGADIAEMVLYLSDKGRFITGQVIGVNGGMC